MPAASYFTTRLLSTNECRTVEGQREARSNDLLHLKLTVIRDPNHRRLVLKNDRASDRPDGTGRCGVHGRRRSRRINGLWQRFDTLLKTHRINEQGDSGRGKLEAPKG
ncbi:hypothetical protein C8035_v000431 [Colletotrichum spinosum]|uniref:Uncharacterized protein n=1 Tax=Colletotrichum spinosum TaxID=1347390 RepID=A0A4R8PQ47_9PEZI|nr:hypothetical protein C8035_v000431 [Colletotrichum spinosum]